MLPQVIIIGRPNVGKSTLFNRLVGKKLALVDDQPGVTRDRRFGEADLLGLEFQIVDTAGWEDDDAETLPGRMRKQTEASLETRGRCAVRDGCTRRADAARRGNRALAARQRRCRWSCSPTRLKDARARAGCSKPMRWGWAIRSRFRPSMAKAWPTCSRRCCRILEPLQPEDGRGRGRRGSDAARPLKLAIVGRPNAGKSTLINRLLGEDRLLTGPEAGITRDSIAIDWLWTDPKTGEGRAECG